MIATILAGLSILLRCGPVLLVTFAMAALIPPSVPLSLQIIVLALPGTLCATGLGLLGSGGPASVWQLLAGDRGRQARSLAAYAITAAMVIAAIEGPGVIASMMSRAMRMLLHWSDDAWTSALAALLLARLAFVLPRALGGGDLSPKGIWQDGRGKMSRVALPSLVFITALLLSLKGIRLKLLDGAAFSEPVLVILACLVSAFVAGVFGIVHGEATSAQDAQVESEWWGVQETVSILGSFWAVLRCWPVLLAVLVAEAAILPSTLAIRVRWEDTWPSLLLAYVVIPAPFILAVTASGLYGTWLGVFRRSPGRILRLVIAYGVLSTLTGMAFWLGLKIHTKDDPATAAVTLAIFTGWTLAGLGLALLLPRALDSGTLDIIAAWRQGRGQTLALAFAVFWAVPRILATVLACTAVTFLLLLPIAILAGAIIAVFVSMVLIRLTVILALAFIAAHVARLYAARQAPKTSALQRLHRLAPATSPDAGNSTPR